MFEKREDRTFKFFEFSSDNFNVKNNHPLLYPLFFILSLNILSDFNTSKYQSVESQCVWNNCYTFIRVVKLGINYYAVDLIS